MDWMAQKLSYAFHSKLSEFPDSPGSVLPILRKKLPETLARIALLNSALTPPS
jgi:hypothetical protein